MKQYASSRAPIRLILDKMKKALIVDGIIETLDNQNHFLEAMVRGSYISK